MAAAVATSEPVNGLGLALVKQELECGVCLDLYERPVTLAWYLPYPTPPHPLSYLPLRGLHAPCAWVFVSVGTIGWNSAWA
jgi:hypothetical protein